MNIFFRRYMPLFGRVVARNPGFPERISLCRHGLIYTGEPGVLLGPKHLESSPHFKWPAVALFCIEIGHHCLWAAKFLNRKNKDLMVKHAVRPGCGVWYLVVRGAGFTCDAETRTEGLHHLWMCQSNQAHCPHQLLLRAHWRQLWLFLHTTMCAVIVLLPKL